MESKNVPTKLTSTRYNQPWFNRDCKIAVRKKKRKHSIYKKSNRAEDELKYKKAAKEARIICNQVRNQYIKSAIDGDESKFKNKKLFTYIKHE